MTREDVERAAKEDVLVDDEFEDYAIKVLVAFTIQQIDAALEEAAKLCDDGDDPNRFVARIRALKIGAGE